MAWTRPQGLTPCRIRSAPFSASPRVAIASLNRLYINSELYSPLDGMWSSGGSTSAQLWDSAAACGGEDHASFELGPGVLRPSGDVFYSGANSCGTGNTAIYNSKLGTWSAGPQFPGGDDVADGPAALEPNGDVLIMTSPGVHHSPVTFFQWNGNTLSPVPGTPNAPIDSSFYGNMLVLPTGQILLTDFSNDIEIYTPVGEPRQGWRPAVLFSPRVVSRPSRKERAANRGWVARFVRLHCVWQS